MEFTFVLALFVFCTMASLILTLSCASVLCLCGSFAAMTWSFVTLKKEC